MKSEEIGDNGGLFGNASRFLKDLMFAGLIFVLLSCDRSSGFPSGTNEPLLASVNSDLSDVERGKELYQRYGCHLCHGQNTEKGIQNMNNQTGGVIVGLTRVAEGFKKKEVEKKILEGVWDVPRGDPKGPVPPYRMPGWKGRISEKDTNALIEYLYSLMPEEKEDDW